MTPEEHKAIAIGLVRRPYKHETIHITDEMLKMSSEELQTLLKEIELRNKKQQ